MGREMASAFARWCALDDLGVQPVLTAVADLSESVLAWFDRIPTVRCRTREYRELLGRTDIDIVYVYGYGFPVHRGGPMFYADTVGPAAVYDDVCAFQKRHGELWQPAPLLERLAREGKRFLEL